AGSDQDDGVSILHRLAKIFANTSVQQRGILPRLVVELPQRLFQKIDSCLVLHCINPILRNRHSLSIGRRLVALARAAILTMRQSSSNRERSSMQGGFLLRISRYVDWMLT